MNISRTRGMKAVAALGATEREPPVYELVGESFGLPANRRALDDALELALEATEEGPAIAKEWLPLTSTDRLFNDIHGFLKNATGDGSNADFAILGGRDRGAHWISALFEAAVVDEVDDEYDEFAAQLPADRERNLAEIREKRLGEFCDLVVNCRDRTGLVRVLEDELESVEFTHQIIEDMCATAGGEAVRGVLDAIIRDTCAYVRPDKLPALPSADAYVRVSGNDARARPSSRAPAPEHGP